MKSIIDFAHACILEYVNEKSTVIDATSGNGHDTCFLAKHVNKVYAFDIQQLAIDTTSALLKANDVTNVTLIHDSHVHMAKYVQESVSAIVFNLGYLPQSDKTITTTADTTIQAIKEGLKLLTVQGVIVLTVYTGHDVGNKEARAITEFVKRLEATHYDVLHYSFINRLKAPYNIIIKKTQ